MTTPAESAPDDWSERARNAMDRLPFEHPGLAGAVGVVVLAAGAWLAFRPVPPPAELTLPRIDTSEVQAEDEAATTDVTVHAAGAVARPGVYRLPAGSRVSDLVRAAGGPTDDADLDQLNLAARLSDGERVLVLRRGQAPTVGEGDPGSQPAGKLDLNSATAAQLEDLPGIGPATAEAIIRHRETHGRFRSVTELLEVRGIGEAKLSQLRPLVKV